MLKKLKFAGLVVLAILLLATTAQLIASQPSVVVKRFIATGGLAKPDINLEINYLAVIPVARARIEDLGQERFRGADLIHLRAGAKTFDCLASIFFARATVDSYIEPG
ncbi:MAG: hypothetical protein ACOY3D_01145, partial [Candidatus Omnitrophota bacterium]